MLVKSVVSRNVIASASVCPSGDTGKERLKVSEEKSD